MNQSVLWVFGVLFVNMMIHSDLCRVKWPPWCTGFILLTCNCGLCLVDNFIVKKCKSQHSGTQFCREEWESSCEENKTNCSVHKLGAHLMDMSKFLGLVGRKIRSKQTLCCALAAQHSASCTCRCAWCWGHCHTQAAVGMHLLFFFFSSFFPPPFFSLVSWCSPILSKSCNLYNGQLAEILTNLHFPLSCTIASSIVITIPISTTARQYWISLSLHGMMVSILIPLPCCILVAACLCFRLCCSFKMMMMTTMTMMTSFQSSC